MGDLIFDLLDYAFTILGILFCMFFILLIYHVLTHKDDNRPPRIGVWKDNEW